jgi:ankyrin repeat protein
MHHAPAAAEGGSLEAFQLLIGWGADIGNRQGTPYSGSSTYTSCLEAAAAGGKSDIIQLALDRGTFQRHQWLAAVTQVAGHGHLQALRLLLDNQDSITKWEYETAFGRAAQHAHVAAMQLILEHSVSLRQSLRKFSASGLLGHAITQSQWAAVKLLLKAGAHTGHRALMHAVFSSYPAYTCKLLLKAGAQDADHQALMAAGCLGQQEVVDMLTARDAADPGRAASLLQVAINAAASGGCHSLLQHLLRKLGSSQSISLQASKC